MIFCETLSDAKEAFEDLVTFVGQLNAQGVPAKIGKPKVTELPNRNIQFEVSAFMDADGPQDGDTLLLIKAHEVNDKKLAELRKMNVPDTCKIVATGKFPDFQSVISIKSKLSYVLGGNPDVIDIPGGIIQGSHFMPIFGVDMSARRTGASTKTILLVGPNLSSDAVQADLLALSSVPGFKVAVLTDGKTKSDWSKKHGPSIPFFQFGEIIPSSIAARADVAMLYMAPSNSYRLQSILANMVASGVSVVDCHPQFGHAKSLDCILKGPAAISGIASWVQTGILDQLKLVGSSARNSKFGKSIKIETVLPGLFEGSRKVVEKSVDRDILFIPTNGVGLGHAQRCSLIATELLEEGRVPVFAAFPSCMKMLKGYGFDVMPLVSRSSWHAQEHENDLVNHARLNAVSADKKLIVFDGGYVFDSIYRTIADSDLRGIWIRRGMWQKGQDNSIALDREKIFDKIIVPLEAFDELNESYSAGDHIESVGPIVQKIDMTKAQKKALRSDIAKSFGVKYKHLAVTMLGGGVAADRSAQVASICAMMEDRKDTLHLLVVWPTATVEAGAFSWKNTRVVKTHHASALVAAADLYISAVGYNSFHECMYNHVPAIFMAQMNAFMDDQRTRAMAAVNRGLADIVEPHEMMSLRTKVQEFLDHGRADEIREKFLSLELPEPGNKRAAHIIKELAK